MWLDVRDAAGTVVGCAVRVALEPVVPPARNGSVYARPIRRPGIAGRSGVDEVVEGWGGTLCGPPWSALCGADTFTPPTAAVPGAHRHPQRRDMLRSGWQFAIDAALPPRRHGPGRQHSVLAPSGCGRSTGPVTLPPRTAGRHASGVIGR